MLGVVVGEDSLLWRISSQIFGVRSASFNLSLGGLWNNSKLRYITRASAACYKFLPLLCAP